MEPSFKERFFGLPGLFGQLDDRPQVKQDYFLGVFTGTPLKLVVIFFFVLFLLGDKELLEILELDIIEPAFLFQEHLDALEIDAVAQDFRFGQIDENRSRDGVDVDLDIFQVVAQLDIALVYQHEFLYGLVDAPVGHVFQELFGVLVGRVLAVMVVERGQFGNLADLAFNKRARDLRPLGGGIIQFLHDKNRRKSRRPQQNDKKSYLQHQFHCQPPLGLHDNDSIASKTGLVNTPVAKIRDFVHRFPQCLAGIRYFQGKKLFYEQKRGKGFINPSGKIDTVVRFSEYLTCDMGDESFTCSYAVPIRDITIQHYEIKHIDLEVVSRDTETSFIYVTDTLYKDTLYRDSFKPINDTTFLNYGDNRQTDYIPPKYI